MLSPVGYRLHGSISDYIYVCYSCVLLRTEVFLSAFLFSLNVLWRCSTIGKKDNNIQINEEIRDKELRVISSDGQQLGIMSATENTVLSRLKGRRKPERISIS